MSAELIRKHFVQFLGVDVGVSFNDANDPREVVLYRPDKLSETFVRWAFEALENAAPHLAARIDRLAVSYESRLGRTQRGVSLSRADCTSESELCSESIEDVPSSTGQTKRYHAATCTVCGDPALEVFVSAQTLEIECGRCGGYSITVEDKARISKLPVRERKAWLDQIRQQALSSSAAVRRDINREQLQ